MTNYADILGLLYYKLKVLKEARSKIDTDIYNTKTRRNNLNGKIDWLENKKSDLLDDEVFIIKNKDKGKLLKLFYGKSVDDLSEIDKEIRKIESIIEVYKKRVIEYDSKIKAMLFDRKNINIEINKVLNDIRSNKYVVELTFNLNNNELIETIFASSNEDKKRKGVK